MRRWVLAAGATALIGLPTVLAFFSGGFFDEPRIIAALAAWALVVLVALFAPRPLPVSTPGRLALLGLVLLCAWTALSLTWAPIGGRAQDDLQRLLLYLGAFTAAIALLRETGVRRALEPALALGTFVVCAYGLSERLLPTIIDLDQSGSSAGRLEQPLTYWNAYGILAAVGFVLAVRVAGDPARGRALRSLVAGAGVVLGAVRLPQLCAWCAGGGGGRPAGTGGPGPGVAASAAQHRDGGGGGEHRLDRGQCPPDGHLAGRTRQRRRAARCSRPWSWPPLRRRWSPPGAPRNPRELPSLPVFVSRPATVAGVALLVLVVGGLVLAAYEGKPEGASPAAGADPARLGSIDTNRYRYWEIAATSFAEHPLRGLGSGGFQVVWLKNEDRVDAAADAHSLYLETAAELGLVGLAFLLLFFGGVGAALVRFYRRAPGAADRAGRGPGGVGLSRRARLGLGDAGGHAARAAVGRGGRGLERGDRPARPPPGREPC